MIRWTLLSGLLALVTGCASVPPWASDDVQLRRLWVVEDDERGAVSCLGYDPASDLVWSGDWRGRVRSYRLRDLSQENEYALDGESQVLAIGVVNGEFAAVTRDGQVHQQQPDGTWAPTLDQPRRISGAAIRDGVLVTFSTQASRVHLVGPSLDHTWEVARPTAAAIGDGLVLIGGGRRRGRCTVHCFAIDSGEQRWQQPSSNRSESMCIEPGHAALVITPDDLQIRSLDDGSLTRAIPLSTASFASAGPGDARTGLVHGEQIGTFDHQLVEVRLGPLAHRGGGRAALSVPGSEPGTSHWITGGSRGDLLLWSWKDVSP